MCAVASGPVKPLLCRVKLCHDIDVFIRLLDGKLTDSVTQSRCGWDPVKSRNLKDELDLSKRQKGGQRDCRTAKEEEDGARGS